MAPITIAILILLPQRMYYQPGHPVPINIDLQALGDQNANLQLHLLSPDGQTQATAPAAPEPSFDLAQAFQGDHHIWDGQHHLVQLTAGDKPIGTPLAVVPLRMPGTPPSAKPEALRIFPLQDVNLHTDHGDIRIRLAHHVAPNTAMHFEHLVQNGFYTNIKFHRIIPGFVIQGGDPTGTGTGGPGYMLDLEPSDMKHDLGVLSMARRGNDINTSGSQFFICLSRDATQALDTQYTAFGNVTEGIDVVKKIAATKLIDRASGRPAQPPLINTASLTPANPIEITTNTAR